MNVASDKELRSGAVSFFSRRDMEQCAQKDTDSSALALVVSCFPREHSISSSSPFSVSLPKFALYYKIGSG